VRQEDRDTNPVTQLEVYRGADEKAKRNRQSGKTLVTRGDEKDNTPGQRLTRDKRVKDGAPFKRSLSGGFRYDGGTTSFGSEPACLRFHTDIGDSI